LQAAVNESLQRPVDPLKLVGSKVHTFTMPFLALHLTRLTSCLAVIWPSSSSSPSGTRLELSATVQAPRAAHSAATDVSYFSAFGMCYTSMPVPGLCDSAYECVFALLAGTHRPLLVREGAAGKWQARCRTGNKLPDIRLVKGWFPSNFRLVSV
jgi:hypothetical protein